MAGLINDASMWDYDTGNLLEQGQLSMVIDKQTYDNAISNIKQIDAEKNRLLEELRTNANYGQQQFDENIKELTQQQMEALQDAKSALESFTETVELTAQKQLAALNKVIDKYKESLNKKKEYWDYDKQLKNQNKEIALLEAQSRALADVTDAESKAMKAKIDAQIKQRREEQSDTIRDQAVSLQTNGLTDLQNKLQENYDRWSHQFEASSQAQLEVMMSTNMTTTKMANTMNNLLATFGTSMKQMGVQVSTVNAATTSAIYAVNGKFAGFVRGDSAYTAAQRANMDLQRALVQSLNTQISDTMTNKLTVAWATLTSGGEAAINTNLDVTSSVLSSHLTNLESATKALPSELSDPLKLTNIQDSIETAAKSVTDSFETQVVNTLNGSIVDVNNSVIGGTNAICGSLASLAGQLGTLAQAQSAPETLSSNYVAPTYDPPAPEPTVDQQAAVREEAAAPAPAPAEQTFVVTFTSDDSSKKKKKKKKKAGGSLSINKRDDYLTQEKGGEIITTKNGVLVPLDAGDGVIPAQLTKKLFEMAREYPNLPNTNPADLPTIQASGNRFNTTITYGSLLTVNGNVDKEALPGLKQILKESYEYTQKRMAQDAQKAGLRKRY